MKYLLFLSLCSALTVFAFGQKQGDEFSTHHGKCNCDNVVSIDPVNFTIDTAVFKREPPKTVKRRLKLGIYKGCIYVIDSAGNVQPYTVKKFQYSASLYGGNSGGTYKINCINCATISSNGTLPLICNCGIGSKHFFDTVIVEDRSGKEISGLIEPLTVVKIK